MARIDFRFREQAHPEALAEAVALEGPVGKETASKVRALGKLGDADESPDFETDHLVVLERVLHTYQWSDPDVYAELYAEVVRLLTS